MSPISLSKARRLRDAATKRKMYAARSSNQQDEPTVANAFILQDIQSALHEVKQFTMAVHSLLAFNSGLFGVPWSTGEVMEQHFLSPDAGISQTGQSVESFEQRGITSPESHHDGNPEAMELAVEKIQRWYRHARACKSTRKPQHPTATESSSSAQSYRNTFCCLCSENFSLDINEADSCDLCLEPYHTKCLSIVDHPVESFSVCAACTPEAQSRATAIPDENNTESTHLDDHILLPAVESKPGSASFGSDMELASSSGQARKMTDAAANHAWPDFSATQALDFQQWFSDKLDAKRKVAIKSIQWFAEEAEKAEARGDIAAARVSLGRAGELQKAAEKPFDNEHMRRESWVFFREQRGQQWK